MKKFKLILAALVCLSVLSAWAGQWTYNSSNSTLSHNTSGWVLSASQNGTNLTVTGVSQSPGTPSALPLSDPMPGYALVSIGNEAFYSCRYLKSVIIGNSVTVIGDYAFSSCTGLTSVTIGSGATTIRSYVFSRCTTLTSVTIPDSVTSIGQRAFNDCRSLAFVTIPDSVTTIGFSVFADCTLLTSINVHPNNPKYASVDGILYNKSKTTLIQCPGGTGLTSVTITASVTSIGYRAFSGCTSLTAINADPDNSAYASLDGILYNKSKTSLIQCPGGKTGGVAIPSSVTSIGDYAFYDCTSLTAINVDPDNSTYASVDGILYNKSKTSLIQCPGGKIGGVAIPFSVTTIDNNAFYNCTGLTSVTIPFGVPSIGDGMFRSCTSLTAINVHSSNAAYASVDGILFNKNQNALIQYPCGKAGNYTIPFSVTRISYGAFVNCASLTSILFMGAPPELLGQDVFGDTPATLYYLNGAPGWTETFGGRPAAPFPFDFTLANGQITIDLYTGSGTASVHIPAAIAGYPVIAIGDAAFYGQTNMTAVTIPDSVTAVGLAAFTDCTALETVVLGRGIAEVDNWAFYGCISLTAIYARGDAPSLGTAVFYDTPATIYYQPETTGWGAAFGDRPAVLLPYAYTILSSTVRIDAYLGDGGQVEIPEFIEGLPVAEIGESAFENCTTLTSVTIPATVRYIGKAAFFNCVLLTDITLQGWSLSTIDDWAFAGCESLTNLILPGSVSSIGNFAFAFCTSLSEVYLESYTPPILGVSVFDWTAATVYYSANSGDWSTTFGGRPTLLWNPTIQYDTAFGFAPDGFGFNISGTANIPVKVEATTNLASHIWTPVTNATLNSFGSLFVTDPASCSLPARFYRIVWP
ncbi:MAG: leucine-rich repeat protein [Kiritimatiellia bacterium]